MTTFKTFLKVMNKCKFPIIMYTVILIVFGGLNMTSNDTSMDFTATKPDIYIVNNDSESKITDNLIKYMSDNCEVIDIKNDEDSINDAIFYRDINFVMYIPQNYHVDFMNGKNPQIEIKTTGDYNASLANMMLTRYLKAADIYQNIYDSEDEIIAKINESLDIKTDVKITSKLDTVGLAKAAVYYNFLSYSMLAGTIYVICLILYSFHEEKIKKRTIISSTNYKKHNLILLGGNSILAFALWILYVILSYILIGDIILTSQGLIYILNSFIFTFCCVTLAFLISNLVNNKNAISGLINIVALGSSFLCGAFVPMEWLPDFVLKIAHALPSYWYIKTNEDLKVIETINFESLRPLFINMGVVILFSIGFIIISNIVSKKKQKIA